jgi:hypothetical protein
MDQPLKVRRFSPVPSSAGLSDFKPVFKLHHIFEIFQSRAVPAPGQREQRVRGFHDACYNDAY